MSIKDFIEKLQQRVLRFRASVQKSQPGRLRVMNLEDRRLLDATAGFLAGQLLLDGFDVGQTLSINEDVGGHLDFDLSSGKWGTISGTGLSLINSDQTLRIDAANVGDLQELGINAGDVALAGIDANADLKLDRLQIQNGGDVEVSDLAISGNASIDATTVTDSANSEISILGSASFQADSITLGDNIADVTNFGSLTFVSSGDVAISEDSATQISGTNSAATLILASDSAITNAAASVLDVSGAATISGATIQLDDVGGSEVNFGSLVFTSAGEVTIDEASDLQVAANSSGDDVKLTAAGDIQSSTGASVTATSLSLTAAESLTSEGAIGSSSQNFEFETNQLSTSSDGSQFLATTTATQFSVLRATDNSTLFDVDDSATIFLNDGEFTGTGVGITGSLSVADSVALSTDAAIVDLQLAATSDVTFRIESVDAAGGAVVGDFDQWQVSNSVSLGGAALTIADQNLLANGTTVRLINNSGTAVNGTFAGLAEGDSVTGTSGQRYRISYVGGDGNDVELTALTSTFSFAETASTVAENVSGASKVIVLNRTGDVSTAASVTVDVAGGTAVQGTDFAATTTLTASFAAGSATATLSVEITDDAVVEADENLSLTLVTPSDGFVDSSANSATLTISNDDVTTIQFSLASASVVEGDSGITTKTYQVSSSHVVDGGFSIAVTSQNVQAVSGSDFTLQTSLLSFTGTANERLLVTVDVAAETTFEADESFLLQLGSVTAGNNFIDVGSAFSIGDDLQIEITNDDTEGLVVLDSGRLTITDETVSGQNNSWSIRFDNATSEVVLTSDQANLGTGTAVGSSELRFDSALITQDIVFDGRGGDDVLTVDFRNGNPIVGTGLSFFGGAETAGGSGDGLSVIGDGVLNVTYTPDAANFGDGEVTVSGRVIQFEGLEPIDVSGFATATLNLPGAADVLTIQDGSDFFGGGIQDALRVSGTSGGVAIETVAFFNNDNLVIDTLASGSDGIDLITINSATGNHANTNLTIDTASTAGDQIEINGQVEIDGDLNFSSTTISINAASVTAGGDQVLTGSVVADQNVTLVGDLVSVVGSLDSAAAETNSVTVTGNAVLDGNVGSSDALSALSVSGTTALSGNVTTVGQQSFGDAFTLASDAVLTSTSNGSIQFQGTVDGAFNLTANTSGTTRFFQAVGSTTALTSLTTNAGGATTISGGVITTTGAQSFSDSVVLTADTVLNASVVSLLGTAGGGGNDLTINGNLNLQSNVSAIANLDVMGTSELNGNVVTAGRQDYRGSVNLSGDSSLTGVGLRFHDTVDGDQLLTANGAAGGLQFDAAVGSGTALSGVNSTGSTVIFDGDVEVDDEGLSVTSVSAVEFAGDVTSTNGGSVEIDNGGNLTLATGTTFQLDGSFQQTGAGLVTSGADILTTGDAITLASAVTQTAAVALRTTEAGSAVGANISLQAVNSAGFDLNLNAGTGGSVTATSVSSAGQLTVEQSVSTTFAGAVTATSISLVDTVGSVTFEDDVNATSLLTAAEGYSVRLLEDATITNAVVFANTGGVTFGDSTNDAQTFSGGITSTASLTAVQGTVQTSSSNLILGQTTLVDSTTLTTALAGGNITVGQISGSGISLTANAGTGAVDLRNVANVIGDLSITADEAIIFEADDVTQGTAWTVANHITVSADGHDIILDQVDNSLGNVTLTADNVRLSEAGDITIDSIVATNNVQLTSAAAINDSSVNSATDIQAASVSLNAAAGIGNIEAIEIQTPVVSAITTTGAIDLANSSTTATTVQNLTTTDGEINYQQTSLADVGFDSVSNLSGDVSLATAASNLLINGDVTAATGDVDVSSVGGSIALDGIVTAANQTVTISSGRAVLGDAANTAADIVANRLVISAAEGIGISSPIETTVNELAVTTTGVGRSRIVNSVAVEVLGSALADDLELNTLAGDVTVSGTVNAAGLSVLLQSDAGRVVDTAGGSVIADELGINSATGIDFSQAANNVTSFAATTTTGNVRFLEADGFQVNSIAAVGLFDGAVGVTTFANGSIDLNSLTGDLAVNESIRSEAGSIIVEASNGAALINEAVVSNSADVNVTGDRVQLDSMIATAAAADVRIVANAGDVVMAAGATSTTDAGSITVLATGNVDLASLASSTGDLFVTADSDANLTGAITDTNAASTNLSTTGSTELSAATGIDVDTNVPNIIADVTATGNVAISEFDSITLTRVTAADGSISVESNGQLLATSVVAGTDAADSVDLSTTAGDLIATNVVASGRVTLDADSGQIQIANVESTESGITATADAGGIEVQSAIANSTGAIISLTATGDIVDSGAVATNLSAVDGAVTLSAANIGSAGSDVFKPTASNALRIDADRVSLTATGIDPDGIIAVDLQSDSLIETLSGNHVFVQSAGSVDLSTATPIANSLSIIADGNIVLPGSVSVTDDLRLEAELITSVPGPTIDLNATRILFVSGSSANLSITASEFDGKTDGDLTVSSDSALLQLTDLNCDLAAIHTNGATATLNQTTGGRIVQQLPVDTLQNSRILSNELLLTGSGTFELTNSTNNVSTLAAATVGSIAYSDVDSIAIGTVDGSSGITTSDQDLLIDVGESIKLQQQIDVSSADVRLTVGSTGTLGNVVQDAAGIITADQLGIRNESAAGDLLLAADNDVNSLSAFNTAAGGSIVFQDVDEVTVATVSAASVPDAAFVETAGVTTNNGDVTIASGPATLGANSLLLDATVNAGSGTVRLLVDGNLNQNAAGVIQANQLGVRQAGAVGDVILDDANAVNQLAINNSAAGGSIGFQNQQALTIGSVAQSTFSAVPNAAALQFGETTGLTTDDGKIQLNVNSVIERDGEIRFDQAVDAGDAAIGLTSNGRISQTATATITATDLLVRQEAEAVGVDVDLGTAANDVVNVAIRNLSEGGDILLNDASDLTIDTVNVADAGNLSIASFAGIDTDAGDINVTSTLDLTVNQNINAASDTSTAAIDETITLISRSGNFTLADGTVISTDEDPTAGNSLDVTGDRIDILAGTDGTAGIVDLGDPATIELRTDGGVARQIAPRPSGFTTVPTTGVETAFVTLTDAANSRQNLTFTENGFLGELDFIFGVAGEENLEVVVDFGVITLIDLTANGVARNAVQQPSGIFVFDDSDFTESVFQIGVGGERYQISHLFETGDLVTTPNDRNGRQFNPNIIGVRFSVAQHESINVFGTGAVDPTSPATVATAASFTGFADAVTDASGNSISPTAAGLSLLTSTDTNGLRNLQAEASSDFPLQNLAVTSTGQPIGLAEFEFIAGPPPGIVRFQPTERFVADYPEVIAPIDVAVISEISGDAFFGDGAASDGGVGTDVYLQIRRYFELDAPAEIVIARINDSDLITSREAFEEFVAENADLQDGAGYEVWLVTETGGQRVERPVVQFEITGGRPGPATESLLKTNQPDRLMDVEFEQADQLNEEPQDDSKQKSLQNQPSKDEDDPSNQQPPAAPVPVDDSNLQSALDSGLPSSESEPVDSTKLGQLGDETIPALVGDTFIIPPEQVDHPRVNPVDSGVTESTAAAGFAVSAFGAVSRFRSRKNLATSNHSLTSRTMKSLRDRASLPEKLLSEDQL